MQNINPFIHERIISSAQPPYVYEIMRFLPYGRKGWHNISVFYVHIYRHASALKFLQANLEISEKKKKCNQIRMP